MLLQVVNHVIWCLLYFFKTKYRISNRPKEVLESNPLNLQKKYWVTVKLFFSQEDGQLINVAIF